MHHFHYRGGELHAEAVNLAGLARTVGTPFYCYSTATLERHYRVFSEAFADVKAVVCYAMKANSNQSVLRTLAKLGAGADVVSGGELKRALAAGIPPEKILFSGIGKTETELRAALDADLLCINIESEPELELLSRLAAETGRNARISVRVNPDVDSGSHAKISTGKSENKFGVPLARAREVYAHAAKLPGIRVTGVDMHIGSQITDLVPLEAAFRLLAEFVQTLRADGHTITHVDFGGGLGIPYHADRCGCVRRADHRRRRGRPGLRKRRLSRARQDSARTQGWRSAGDHDGRRLRRGAVRHLQHPRAGARSVGEERPVRRGAAAGGGR